MSLYLKTICINAQYVRKGRKKTECTPAGVINKNREVMDYAECTAGNKTNYLFHRCHYRKVFNYAGISQMGTGAWIGRGN